MHAVTGGRHDRTLVPLSAGAHNCQDAYLHVSHHVSSKYVLGFGGWLAVCSFHARGVFSFCVLSRLRFPKRHTFQRCGALPQDHIDIPA